METRRLGRTGHMSSVVTFGSAGIGRVTQDVADRSVTGFAGGLVLPGYACAKRPRCVGNVRICGGTFSKGERQ